MAATYDSSDLDASTASGRLNIVRLLLSDNEIDSGTTVKRPEFDDAEIEYFLASSSGEGDDVYAAALAAARAAAAKYARLAVNRQVGDLSIDARGRAEEWRNTISSIKAQRAEQSPGLAPLIGQDTTSAEYDPVFALDMHDNPRGASSDLTRTESES